MNVRPFESDNEDNNNGLTNNQTIDVIIQTPKSNVRKRKTFSNQESVGKDSDRTEWMQMQKQKHSLEIEILQIKRQKLLIDMKNSLITSRLLLNKANKKPNFVFF